MIYYDKMTIRLTGTDEQGDPVDPPEVFEFDVPVELWPVQSVEADRSGSPGVVLRGASPFEVDTWESYRPGTWTAPLTQMTIVYQGDALVVLAGFERHTISGRFDHVEFLANNYYTT